VGRLGSGHAAGFAAKRRSGTGPDPYLGRTYWGGAIFCVFADVKIRRQTRNTKGLEHALRAILEAGGDIRSNWDLLEALQIGDRATGTRVLLSLYEEMKDKPVLVDLCNAAD